MTIRPPGGPPPDAPIGVALAFFRHRINLTGAELGKRLNWSQPKVSKIETGAVIPSSPDTDLLAEALGLSAEEAELLRQLGERSRNEMTDWRIGGRLDPVVWQRDIGRLENEAAELRIFQPTVLSGLLQTSENARAILTDIQRTWSEGEFTATSVAAAVSARVQRQEILEDRAKRFWFIVPEAVLHSLLSQAVDMTAQLRRIRDVARQDNVDLRIVTDDTRWPLPPTNGFSLLDDRYLIIDLFNTIVVARGRSDLRLYRRVFEEISAVATTEVEPILDNYRRRYLKRAVEE